MEDVRKNNDTLSREANKIGERLQEVLTEGKENGREAWKKFQARGKEAAEDTRKLIQKHPGKAVGLAVLVGAVIGVLATFRRNKA
jgi:ElaB/YqjD/DUF883 family membrane-anchored ribosome-binding protein